MKFNFIFFLLLIAIAGNAQNFSGNIELSDMQYKNESVDDYYRQISEAELLRAENPDKIKYSYELGKLYLKLNYFDKAKSNFERIVFLPKVKLRFSDSYYYYAKILKTECEYDSAVDFFNKYSEKIRFLPGRRKLKYLCKKELQSCSDLKKRQKNDSIKILHLPKVINQANIEFSPLMINDSSLIFVSLRSEKKVLNTKDNDYLKGKQFYRAVFSDTTVRVSDSCALPFGFFPDKQKYGGSFSPDGRRFYFTVQESPLSADKQKRIYCSKLQAEKWQKPFVLNEFINLPGYDASFPCAAPSFSNDYDILYFVSQRPDGQGGFDIWYSVYDKRKSTHGKPRNAGGIINSPADELSPFYDKNDDCLYFSSDRPETFGAQDIFKSKGSTMHWTEPENPGQPLNSPYDDISYFKYGNRAFFASNRKSYSRGSESSEHCCYDLFEAERISNSSDNYYRQISGVISENKNSFIRRLSGDSVIQKTDLKLYELSGGKQILVEKSTIVPPDSFSFPAEENKSYILKIEREGYLSENIRIPSGINMKNNRQLDTIRYEPISTKPLVFRNIYFKYDSYELTDSSKNIIDSTLLEIMKRYPKIIVEISAHTDYKGSSTYNLKLSEKRALSVVDYMEAKGISRERMVPTGYGETKPIARARAEDGSDLPEIRALNRRIEFLVLGTVFD